MNLDLFDEILGIKKPDPKKVEPQKSGKYILKEIIPSYSYRQDVRYLMLCAHSGRVMFTHRFLLAEKFDSVEKAKSFASYHGILDHLGIYRVGFNNKLILEEEINE